MKINTSKLATGRRLGALAIIAALTSSGLPLGAEVFLFENFDGTLPAPIGGWSADSTQVLNPSYDSVAGVGVGGTTAMQLSGTWQDFGGYIGMLYQNPGISGNADATPANTMMAFDMKVNLPLIYGFSIGLQSWKGTWGGVKTASILDVFTYPDFDLPTDFQTMVLSAADPRWYMDPYNPWDGPFDPSGEIYQVWFGTSAGVSLPLYSGEKRTETLTVDNLRVWTVIDDLTASPAVLWSPNHKMVPVTIDYSISDGGGIAPIVSSDVQVTSNEPANGLGDGDTSPDWEIVDVNHLLLRAERSGTGTGRVYTITITATDSLGNVSTRSVPVTVPLSQGR